MGLLLGLGTFLTAATRDEPVEDALGLDWSEEIFLGVGGLGVPTDKEADRQRRMGSGGPVGFSFPRGGQAVPE